jgi:hypothetical protein
MSHVNVESKTNVSDISSASIIRVDVMNEHIYIVIRHIDPDDGGGDLRYVVFPLNTDMADGPRRF